MAGTYSGYHGAPGTPDTSALPSVELWHQVDADLTRPGRWMHQWEDFDALPFTDASVPTTAGPYGGLRVFTSTGGTFSQVDIEGGVRRLSSDGDDEGASVAAAAAPFKIIQNAGELIFEARIRTSTIADTKHGILVGLMEDTAGTAAIPITAGGALSDHNIVCFHRLEADGDKFDTTYKANGITAVTVKADAITVVADTWLKLGMRFNHDGTNVLEFFENGVKLTDTKAIPSAAGTDFPNDIRLGWVCAVLNATATTPGNTDVDWVRCAQKRITDVASM